MLQTVLKEYNLENWKGGGFQDHIPLDSYVKYRHPAENSLILCALSLLFAEAEADEVPGI